MNLCKIQSCKIVYENWLCFDGDFCNVSISIEENTHRHVEILFEYECKSSSERPTPFVISVINNVLSSLKQKPLDSYVIPAGTHNYAIILKEPLETNSVWFNLRINPTKFNSIFRDAWRGVNSDIVRDFKKEGAADYAY